MDIAKIALTFFIVANPIGNSPVILALIKNFDFKKQKQIMLREAFFALMIALFFQFFGELFLKYIVVSGYTLTYAGGILLLIVALGMVFPKEEEVGSALTKEPFFVPIATPLITGPGTMTMIMVFSEQSDSPLEITLAILLCWVGVTATLYFAPYLQKLLKKRGMIALEQLMGMVLMLVSIQMLLNATAKFLEVWK